VGGVVIVCSEEEVFWEGVDTTVIAVVWVSLLCRGGKSKGSKVRSTGLFFCMRGGLVILALAVVVIFAYVEC